MFQSSLKPFWFIDNDDDLANRFPPFSYFLLIETIKCRRYSPWSAKCATTEEMASILVLWLVEHARPFGGDV